MRHRNSFRLPIAIFAAILVGIVVVLWALSNNGNRPSLETGTPRLTLTVLDVGQGDSIFVRSPAGRTMLVDAGNERSDVERVILPYIRKQGVSSLDYLVLTHPDQDHVGGMPALLDSFPVSTFIDPVHPGETNQAYSHTLQRVQNKGIKAIKARRGQDSIDLGVETRVQILAPEDPLIQDTGSFNNSNSVVLRITLGSMSALLTGDIDETAERRILSHGGDISSQILKVAHHGSRYGSSDPFLDAVSPQVALISVGKGNSYGHPHSQLVQRLERRQIKILRTDINGTLEVAVDGSGYTLAMERQGN